jgi:hypothetical protein
MLLGKCFSGFLSLHRCLLFLGESSLETFEPLLSCSIVSGIFNGVAIRIGEIGFQSDINAPLLARCNVFNGSLRLNTELAVVAVSSSENANTLDLFGRECFNPLVSVPNQMKTTYATTIGKADVSAIWLQFPAGLFVFD